MSLFYWISEKLLLNIFKAPKLALTLMGLLYLNYGLSQNLSIDGIVQDSSNNPIISANVLIKNKVEEIVLFGFSDSEGKFSFNIDDSLLSSNLHIEVRAIGFQSKSESINRLKKFYSFTLNHDYKVLDNIISTLPPVKERGDTLSYNTSSFSSKEDRNIGDVIRRLPGMTITEEGKILYMGQPVNNLLIGNDDLMNGRYGLATKSISQNLISRVEVIKHYQPLAVLQNKIHSDDVVVNLVLKNENDLSISGKALAGAGLPIRVNSGIDLIMLNKKIKMVNSFNYNNSGIDYKPLFKNLQTSESEQSVELLSDAVVDNPGVPSKYIYDNSSFFIGGNNLVNAKDTLQLTGNVRVYFDKNYVNYNSRTETYLSQDTLYYRESQNVIRTPKLFDLDLSLNKNKKKYYLKNQTSLHFGNNNSQSNLAFNDSRFSAQLSNRTQQFKNQFHWIPQLLKRDIVSLNWDLSYYSNPQNLLIQKGIDSNLLNNGKSYKEVMQSANIPTFASKISIDYIVNNTNKLKSSYQLGIEKKWEQLNSKIRLHQWDGSSNYFEGDPGNNLIWNESKLFVSPVYWYKSEYLSLSLSLPFEFQEILYSQKDYELTGKDNSFFLNPSLSGEYFVNSENSFSAILNQSSSFGNIEDIYRALVITNFRQFRSNDAFIRKIRSNNFKFQYNFKNTVNLLFANVGLSYKRQNLNAIYSTEFKEDIQIVKTLPIHNSIEENAFFAMVSKYIFPLKSKVEFKGDYSKAKVQQRVNGKLVPFTIKKPRVGITVLGKPTDFFTAEYLGSINWFRNKSTLTDDGSFNSNSSIRIISHNLSLSYTPLIPAIFTLNAKYELTSNSINSSSNYFFMDARARFSPRKPKMDVEFGIDNLLNVKYFTSYYSNANQLFAANYLLLGRTTYFKVEFYF